MSKFTSGRRTVLAGVAIAALGLSACGGNTGSTSKAAADGEVTVGVIPIIDIAPLQMAIEDGDFEDAGIKVTTQNAQGGAAIVPAVISGDFQFGYGNLVSLMSAQENGLKLKVIAIGGRASADEMDDGAGQLIVKDPAIKSVKDLQGKTIGINTLKGINEIAVRQGLEKAGLKSDAAKLIEVPIPNMRANLDQGKVDAVMISEPFTSMAKADGARALPISYASMGKDMPFAAWFTTEKYAQENPEQVEAFTTTLTKALESADEDDAAARKSLNGYLELEDGVAEEVTLPGWEPSVDAKEFQPLADLAEEYGVIKDSSSAEQLVGKD